MSGVQLFLIVLLAGSAIHKAMAWQRLSLSAARLTGGSPVHGVLALGAAGTLEIMSAIALCLAQLHRAGALIAAFVWAAYALALLRHRGEALDCGCDLSSREKPVGLFAILRPATLAAVALVLAFSPAVRWTLDAPFAAAAMLGLYLAASELAALAPVRKGFTG